MVISKTFPCQAPRPLGRSNGRDLSAPLQVKRKRGCLPLCNYTPFPCITLQVHSNDNLNFRLYQITFFYTAIFLPLDCWADSNTLIPAYQPNDHFAIVYLVRSLLAIQPYFPSGLQGTSLVQATTVPHHTHQGFTFPSSYFLHTKKFRSFVGSWELVWKEPHIGHRKRLEQSWLPCCCSSSGNETSSARPVTVLFRGGTDLRQETVSRQKRLIPYWTWLDLAHLGS